LPAIEATVTTRPQPRSTNPWQTGAVAGEGAAEVDRDHAPMTERRVALWRLAFAHDRNEH
jgi:hypothetical protein